MANNRADEIEAALRAAAGVVRDPVPGVLESDGRHKRHSGYEGIGTDTESRNERKQPSGQVHPYDTEA
jgi:hypothetical protein